MDTKKLILIIVIALVAVIAVIAVGAGALEGPLAGLRGSIADPLATFAMGRVTSPMGRDALHSNDAACRINAAGHLTIPLNGSCQYVVDATQDNLRRLTLNLNAGRGAEVNFTQREFVQTGVPSTQQRSIDLNQCLARTEPLQLDIFKGNVATITIVCHRTQDVCDTPITSAGDPECEIQLGSAS
ncbi:MAG: hypothetical protein U0670_18015 [Anaerolineae bacterium]